MNKGTEVWLLSVLFHWNTNTVWEFCACTAEQTVGYPSPEFSTTCTQQPVITNPFQYTHCLLISPNNAAFSKNTLSTVTCTWLKSTHGVQSVSFAEESSTGWLEVLSLCFKVLRRLRKGSPGPLESGSTCSLPSGSAEKQIPFPARHTCLDLNRYVHSSFKPWIHSFQVSDMEEKQQQY